MRVKEAAIKALVQLDTVSPEDAFAKQQCHGCQEKTKDDWSQYTPLFDTNNDFKGL